MCGPAYDRKDGVPNIADKYTIQCRLDMLYSYRLNSEPGETEKEYYKRMGWKYK